MAFFLPQALPKPPGTPVVTESTATSITLTWDSGNPEPVSYYIIQHKPKNSEEPYKEIDGVATTRYSVAGLSPYSDYEFRVVAVNNIGRGPPSEPVLTQTSEQAPSSAPRDVQARMLSSTTILVQWKEPEEPNGQIQGYRVYYTMDPTQHVNNWMKHNVADSQITTIGNLVPRKRIPSKSWLSPQLEMVLFQVTFKSLLRQEVGLLLNGESGGEELVRRNGRGRNKEQR